MISAYIVRSVGGCWPTRHTSIADIILQDYQIRGSVLASQGSKKEPGLVVNVFNLFKSCLGSLETC